jgi:uncharacterized protein (TIGR03437 family)
MTKTARILFLCTIPAWQLFAQCPDNTGNCLLKGTYYFRHVLYGVSNQPDQNGYVGDIGPAIAVYGGITFDGNGNYTIASGTMVSDSSNGLFTFPQYSPSTVNGTYAISPSGFGSIINPVTGDNIFGLVSANGVFTGSSTEATSAYNDMFIAALMPSPAPGNPFFSGSYTAVAFIPGGSPFYSEDAFFQLNPNGSGGLGTINMTGYYGGGGSGTISQSTANMSYFFSGGAAVLTFPTNANANFYAGPVAGVSSGKEYLYFSPDGNFFFGGSPDSGFDMIVGVRNGTGSQNFSGLFYNAGMYQDESSLSLGAAYFNGYYGSFNVTAGGSIIEHQRISDPANSGAFGSTFADSFTPPITGTYTDPAGYEQYTVGAGGAARVGLGVWPYIGIDLGLQAPKFTAPAGGAPYIDPTGIVNAASFSPFTAGVSGGEFLTLYGANLAPAGTSIFSGNSFPTTLNGVQITVNGTPAPIYYVTPGQVAFVVPFAAGLLAGGSIPIQVDNNGVLSNTVTMLVSATTPGVFTGNSSGLGYGAVEHADGSLVTTSSPAQPGETVVVFVSGLGTVSPLIPDGTEASASNLSYTYPANDIAADISGTTATVTFSGLAPYLIGLYQLNVIIPSTITSGDNYLEIFGPDSDNLQALIPVGSGATSAARKFVPRAHRHSTAPRPPACFFACKSGNAASNASGRLSLHRLPPEPAQ